jgi:hypothetical protein
LNLPAIWEVSVKVLVGMAGFEPTAP